MIKKLTVLAENEKQALLKASKQLNVVEDDLKVKLVDGNEKEGCFESFEGLYEFEISFDADDDFEDVKKIDSVDDIENLQLRNKAKEALNYLDKILDSFGISFFKKSLVFCENNVLKVDLISNELVLVVEQSEKFLDSLQCLVSLCANRFGEEFLRVVLDCGSYREKRKIFLQNLVKKMVKKVEKLNSPVSLEPMNSYERQIVHGVVSEFGFVKSKSVGQEPCRSVVIYPNGCSLKDNNQKI